MQLLDRAIVDRKNLDSVFYQIRQPHHKGIYVEADFVTDTFTVTYDATVVDNKEYDGIFDTFKYDIDLPSYLEKNAKIRDVVNDNYYNTYQGGDLRLVHTLDATPKEDREKKYKKFGIDGFDDDYNYFYFYDDDFDGIYNERYSKGYDYNSYDGTYGDEHFGKKGKYPSKYKKYSGKYSSKYASEDEKRERDQEFEREWYSKKMYRGDYDRYGDPDKYLVKKKKHYRDINHDRKKYHTDSDYSSYYY